MKHLYTLHPYTLLSLALLCGQAFAADKKPLKVFILAGQSNMQGQGIVSSLAEMKEEKPGTLATMLKDPAKALSGCDYRRPH